MWFRVQESVQNLLDFKLFEDTLVSANRNAVQG